MANHLEETVTIELNRDAGTALPHAHRINWADCTPFRLATISGEAGKIMSADEIFRCRFQNLQI
jgi:hypothetical protein